MESVWFHPPATAQKLVLVLKLSQWRLVRCDRGVAYRDAEVSGCVKGECSAVFNYSEVTTGG